MRVLVGCEFSGVVRRAFRERGHDAWSCDLLESEDKSEFHFCGYVEDHLDDGWDMGIFFPPCTYILNSGCKHLYIGGRRWNPDGSENERCMERWNEMKSGALFFKDCLNSKIPKVCCENPVMVGYAQKIVGQRWTQKIHPWQFGHPESKATCLWLRNLEPLTETNNVYDAMMLLPRKERERIHYMSPGPGRGLERSRTFDGIGMAMASQWG